MRKRRNLFISISLSLVMVGFTSCNDNAPAPPAKLSFAESAATYNEADDIIEIEVVLDKPAAEDFTIEYKLDGTAYDAVTADDVGANADYEILGDYLSLDIKKGDKSGVIQIQLISDYYFEDDETIKIELDNVDSKHVEITHDDTIDITLEQEGDGMAILLEWPNPGANGFADMDLILRAGTSIGALNSIVAGSINGSTASGELVFIPTTIGTAAFGLSYTYYEGTLNPLNFEVTFIDVAGGVVEPVANRQKFQGTYTLANINAWTNPSTTQVVQTFTMTSGVFSNFSAITIPSSGSRMDIGGTLDEPITLSNGIKILPAKLRKK
jgi:hypothetical protein